MALIARDPAELMPAVTLEGVDEIVQVRASCSEFDADAYAQALEAVVRKRCPGIILAGFTANGMALGPRVAVDLGLAFASDVVACQVREGEPIAWRQFYGGKVEAELEFNGTSGVVLLLRPKIWTPAVAGGLPAVSSCQAPCDKSRLRTRHLEFIDPPASDLDIGKSTFILAIGRGAGERDQLPRFEALAEKMRATLAASRPLVDAGWLPSSRLVGRSGATVTPRLYLALGVSGAAQHVEGMNESEVIVAVNKDPRAAIFGVAHYGATLDLFQVLEELEKLW